MPSAFAVSSGDPAGIGPEIIWKSWRARKEKNLPAFFAVGDKNVFQALCGGNIAVIDSPDDADRVFADHLPVLNVHDSGPVTPGYPETEGARCALQALEMAVGLARSGGARGVITGPVSKSLLRNVGFTHPGQTEFIAERCGVAKHNAVMMLAGPSLRVVPITVHVALRDVPDLLTTELIMTRARASAKGMIRNFGIDRPRLVIAGLNPHAGEAGNMGSEERDIIIPAVAQLRAEGIDISGPLPADTMFHAGARSRYDIALCCYHDQALVPLKTLHFDEGVNITLGLPIIRTSPDHGTAFDIAGQDIANTGSMIAAIRMAETVWHHRQNYVDPDCGK